MSSRDRYGNPMYGAVHKAARKRFEQAMKRGEVFYCWRPTCPRPNEPIDPRYWDLGHVEGAEAIAQYGSRWPEHPSCNRATLSHAKGVAPKPAPVHDCGAEFDPARCAECRRRDPTPGNTATRWSRHWDEGRFNPRCRACRERGSMCDFALELARQTVE